jgi:hypothetical protein
LFEVHALCSYMGSKDSVLGKKYISGFWTGLGGNITLKHTTSVIN